MNKPGLSPATILVVDDTPANLRLMEDVLRSGGYEVRAFPRGPLALAAAERTPPDLVLLDVMMPGMDGYQVCERLKASPVTREIPVIFLTARTDADDEARGFELGAVDYITKPVSPALLLARLRTHLLLKRAHDFLRDKSDYLEQEVRRRSAEILETRDITIAAMAALAETRDQETGQHIWRTQEYVRELALGLAAHPRFSSYLTLETIDLLYKSAPLHDIGKVGIPDAILRKAGAFTPEEFDLMKRHTLLGRNAIMAAEQRLAVPTPFLTMARDIAGSHHERWDGSGYPDALAGDRIPVAARLMALADVYDALTTARPYKPAWSHEEAVAEIQAGSGSQFDPDAVAAFLERAPRFQEIALRFADPAP